VTVAPLITLFAPGNRPDFIAKAASYKPDALIVDLEDSVPYQIKVKTREEVAALLPQVGLTALVRVNSEPELIEQDLRAVVSPAIYGVMLPMAESVDQVRLADRLIGRIEQEQGLQPGSVKLLLILESALAILRCYDLATAAERVESVVFASAEGGDLQRDLRCSWSIEGTELIYARSKVLLDARAARLPYVLDGAFSRIKDLELLRADCVLSRRLGYDGRTLIHPHHVAVARETYRPSDAEIEESRRLIVSFEKAEADGLAAISFDGKLVDYAMYKRARALVGADISLRDLAEPSTSAEGLGTRGG
jgi:citrate lyase subunit beta/citryl-CoA lyase